MNRKNYKMLIIAVGIAFSLIAGDALAAGMGRGRGGGQMGQGRGVQQNLRNQVQNQQLANQPQTPAPGAGRGMRQGQAAVRGGRGNAPNALQRQVPAGDAEVAQNQNQRLRQRLGWAEGYAEGFEAGFRAGQRQRSGQGQAATVGTAPNAGQRQRLGRGARQGQANAGMVAPNAGQQRLGMRRGQAQVQNNIQAAEPNL
jgi:hypothetical protein